MKASVMTAYGGPEVMSCRDVPDPKPGAGDVLVHLTADPPRHNVKSRFARASAPELPAFPRWHGRTAPSPG